MAHFAMGQLEEAVTWWERAITLYPEVREGYSILLAPAYAHLGRDQEARTALEDFEELWEGVTPNLRDVMYWFPFKDPEVADRFADGLLKAGLAGKPSGYYKLSEEDKLTGEEIRALVFGRTISGFFPGTGHECGWIVPRTGKVPFEALLWSWSSEILTLTAAWRGSREICSGANGKESSPDSRFARLISVTPRAPPK